MELPSNSSGQDTNNRPPAGRGTGSGGGEVVTTLADEEIVLLAHVSLTFKEYTTDLKEGLENLALVDPTAPDNPPEGNQVAFEIWKMDIKGYREKLKVFANFRAGLYSLVLGQCTDALQEQLKSHHDFQNANQDSIALLVIIWSLIHTFEEN